MDTLGIVESKSIACGVELADGMVKAGDVTLVRASTICSGRYTIYVSGERAAVESAVRFAVDSTTDSGRSLMGSFVISQISKQVTDALKQGSLPEKGDAIGVVECRTVVAGINAADKAVKRAMVKLLRLVAGQGINGKSYFVLSGGVDAVREATEAAKEALGHYLIVAVVIPRPDSSVVSALTGGVR